MAGHRPPLRLLSHLLPHLRRMLLRQLALQPSSHLALPLPPQHRLRHRLQLHPPRPRLLHLRRLRAPPHLRRLDRQEVLEEVDLNLVHKQVQVRCTKSTQYCDS